MYVPKLEIQEKFVNVKAELANALPTSSTQVASHLNLLTPTCEI